MRVSSEAAAWYGAIIATMSVVVNILNYLRDRPCIAVIPERNQRIVGTRLYSPDKIYFIVSAINKGRRPVRIGKVGMRVVKDKTRFVLFGDSLYQSDRVLTEESPRTQFIIEQDDDLLSRGRYVVVYDATGKAYVKSIHPLGRLYRTWDLITDEYRR